jgi:uncharacterized membrane protein YqjE
VAADDPTQTRPAQPSIGELVQDASTQISALVRAEIELAKAELSETAKRGGIGAGLFVAAAVVVLLSLPFGFVALAEGLVAVGLWRWLSYLIVVAFFWVLAGLLGLLGYRSIRRLRKPERTLETVKDTARWARHPTSSGATGGGPDAGV